MRNLITIIFLLTYSIFANAEITITSIQGHSILYSKSSNHFKRIKLQTKIDENDIITTSSNGLSVIDFNDEVVGTVVLAPNTQVILRRSNTSGIRLISLVKGHLRVYRAKKYKNKKVGVLVNIRDNKIAYHGTDYEIQYYKQKKLVIAHNNSIRKFNLTKKVRKKPIKIDKKTDDLDQELYEDLKSLLETT